MSDFFRDLGKTITKAAGDVSDKTGDFFEVTKLKGQISSEEKIISQAYAAIGEILYEEYEAGTVVSEEIAEICKDIDRHKKRIKVLEKDLGYVKGGKE